MSTTIEKPQSSERATKKFDLRRSTRWLPGTLIVGGLFLIAACAPPSLLPNPTATPAVECVVSPNPVVDNENRDTKIEVFSPSASPDVENGLLRLTLKARPNMQDWDGDTFDVSQNPYILRFTFTNRPTSPYSLRADMGISGTQDRERVLGLAVGPIDRTQDNTVEICWVNWQTTYTKYNQRPVTPYLYPLPTPPAR